MVCVMAPGAQGEWHGFGSRGFACVCICTVEVLCDTRVHAGGMMLDYITHRSQKTLCVPNTINNFIRIPFWQKCVCKHVNQCPLTATFVHESVCVGEGRNKRGEKRVVITQAVILSHFYQLIIHSMFLKFLIHPLVWVGLKFQPSAEMLSYNVLLLSCLSSCTV